MDNLQEEFEADCNTARRGHCRVKHNCSIYVSCSCFEQGLQIGIELTKKVSEEFVKNSFDG